MLISILSLHELCFQHDTHALNYTPSLPIPVVREPAPVHPFALVAMPFSSAAVQNKKPLLIKRTTKEVKPALKQTVTKSSAPAPSKPRPSGTAKFSKSEARHSYPTPPAERSSRDRKRSTPTRGLNSPQILDFDDDGDESDDEEAIRAVKKRRLVTPDDLPPRKVRSMEAFVEDGEYEVDMIHGEEIPSLDTRVRYQPVFEGLPANTTVELRYPSAAKPERFRLVKGKKSSDYNALEDVHATMKMIAKYYLPEEMRERFDNDSTGFPQRLSRAANKRSIEDLQRVIEEWNQEMIKLRKDGTFAKTASTCWPQPDQVTLPQAEQRAGLHTGVLLRVGC